MSLSCQAKPDLGPVVGRSPELFPESHSLSDTGPISRSPVGVSLSKPYFLPPYTHPVLLLPTVSCQRPFTRISEYVSEKAGREGVQPWSLETVSPGGRAQSHRCIWGCQSRGGASCSKHTCDCFFVVSHLFRKESQGFSLKNPDGWALKGWGLKGSARGAHRGAPASRRRKQVKVKTRLKFLQSFQDLTVSSQPRLGMGSMLPLIPNDRSSSGQEH